MAQIHYNIDVKVMSNKIFLFSKQLKVGDLGENLFLESYNELNPRKSNVREIDFTIDGNKKVELKSDAHSISIGNFFIERYGNIDKKADGSIWRSYNDGLDFFVYCFLPEKTFFWFEVPAFKNYMDKNRDKFEQKIIKNTTWSAMGYLLPQTKVQHLVIRKDIF